MGRSEESLANARKINPTNMLGKQYYIYILTNKSNTLYIGITNDLIRRLYEHKNKLVAGFTKKYNIDRLIYYEVFDSPEAAIQREKEIKGWIRKKKIDLIKRVNPNFKELIL